MRTQASMKAELVAMGLYGDEASARTAWALAYRNYFVAAVANGVSAVAAALAAPQASMALAMTGLSADGAAKLAAGVSAFWSALVPGAVFPPATLITPPAGLATLAAALVSTFAANVSSSATKDAAMDAIATALHTASTGGTATFPGSPPLVVPIL